MTSFNSKIERENFIRNETNDKTAHKNIRIPMKNRFTGKRVQEFIVHSIEDYLIPGWWNMFLCKKSKIKQMQTKWYKLEYFTELEKIHLNSVIIDENKRNRSLRIVPRIIL